MRYHVRNFPQAYFTNRSLCLRRCCVSSAGLILTSLAVFSTSASAASVERIARTEPVTSERAKKKKPLSPIETIRVARDAHRTPRANGSVLTRSDWRNVLSGSNPLALLSQVPGVSYTASDAYGLDESDASLFLRGFHMNELGILFENIPLNETSFGTLNGTNVLNISVPDTIGSIYVSPGTARENLFSNSNNGGEIRYMLLAPTQKHSLSTNQGVGSNNTLVTTLVGQSGQLGANGPKVMAGFQRISKDKYQGSGSQYMTRGNVKATQETGWGAFNAFFSASSARIAGYNDVSHDMLNRLGWRGSDYTYPDYETAYKAALPENADKPCGGGYSCAERAALTPYDSGQVTRDLIGSLTHDFRLTPHLKGKAVFYGATTYTDASVSDPTTPSETGAPFSEQVWHSAVRRFGGSFELGYRLARHDLSAGIWQEAAHSDAHQAWYNEPLLGQGAPLKAIGPFDTYGDAFQTANLSTWNTQSRQIFLHDDWKITDSLTLGAGFKAVDFVSSGGGIGDDQAPRGRLRSQAGFLPHLSALWRYNKHDDVFIDAAQTQSAYRLSPRGNIGYSASIWSASDQASFDEALARIAPERDTTVTIGGHLKRKWISLSWDGYFSLIENRLVSASVGTLHSPVNTVGTVRASHIWGGDVAASLPIGSHFTLRQSLSVSRFRYGGDLFVGGETFDLRGKAQPGYPELSLQTSALVHVSHLEMGATNIVYLNRPFSYTNDIMGPNYWNMTAYASWKFERRGKIPPFTARLDVYNLMNSKMIGNLNVDGAPFSGDLQTMQRSSPRQMVFSLGTQF
ncbi:TonB-dependent receptor [Asaia astilbis]